MALPDLPAVVGESLAVAQALERALGEERQALERQDADGLLAAGEAKRACVAALEKLEQRRQSLCRDAGLDAGPAAMPALLSQAKVPSAAAEWRELLGVLARAERVNLANGAIVRARTEQLAAALAILGGDAAGPGTYEPAGRRAPVRGRRPLATL